MRSCEINQQNHAETKNCWRKERRAALADQTGDQSDENGQNRRDRRANKRYSGTDIVTAKNNGHYSVGNNHHSAHGEKPQQQQNKRCTGGRKNDSPFEGRQFKQHNDQHNPGNDDRRRQRRIQDAEQGDQKADGHQKG